jgi:phosphoribosylaminoimidazolecarboxamide formyltransferase/IMP cyclohydrolase
VITRALLSVSDKTGLLDFAKALAARNVEILSTGGTARALAEAGVPVVKVEDYAGSPEVMDGRVKTLHPRVHGGILMRGERDEADLAKIGGKPIDLVVVNLYPFEQTLRKEGATHDEIIENIDIGGPSMLRSAAKNYARVTVVCDPGDYAAVLEAVQAGGEVPLSLRQKLAAKVFAHTAAYDGRIAQYLSSLKDRQGEQRVEERDPYPTYLTLAFERAYPLRYGENPHQSAAFYRERGARSGALALAESVGAGGKELSYNNLVDLDAALEAVREFDEPAAVVVKHTNPCGVAVANELVEAYRAARASDPVSAFGGIVALNREVDEDTAKALAETFLECIVAPSFAPPALDLLRKKEKLRLLATGAWLPAGFHELVFKRVEGGLLVQDRDSTGGGEVTSGKATTVTKRAPTAEELASLSIGWRVAKHVKSNAIVLVNGRATVGVGAGQMSRVDSAKIACSKAGDRARGAVLASDAFFPFPDSIEVAAEHGVTAIAAPGGSVRDQDCIAAADKAGMAMVFTHVRHFRH